ncbi:MAG TPA: VTT domain-containing protein [Pseudomonas sp.]|nr:VTT domain-containing protein [Pseudomonas sp.]
MHKYGRLLLIALFLAVLFAVFQLSGLRQHFSLPFLQQLLLENKLGGLLVFILLFTLGNLIQLPGLIFLAAAVLALGKTWGGLVTYLAACLSCLFTFGLIRWLGGDALRQLDNRLARRILAHLDAHPLGSIVLLRILFQSVPPLNYALALSGVKWRHYLFGTLLGLPLPLLFYCLLFSYLGKTLHIT